MTLEDKALKLKKNSTEIRFDKRMANKSGEGFLLTTKFYKIENYGALLDPKNRKMEDKAVVHPEGTAFEKQINTKTKKIVTLKIHNKELHAKLFHPKKYMMRTTTQHLQYSVKIALEVCEYWTTEI